MQKLRLWNVEIILNMHQWCNRHGRIAHAASLDHEIGNSDQPPTLSKQSALQITEHGASK